MHVRMYVHACVRVCARADVYRGGLPRRLSSLCEYLAKYFTHREIFTHYTALLSSVPFFPSLSPSEAGEGARSFRWSLSQPRRASVHRITVSSISIKISEPEA